MPNGGAIKKDETLATWDPYNVPVIAEKGGIVEFKDMIVGITVSKETDRETGASSLVVMEHKQELHPQVVIRDAKTREVLAHHAIPAGANLTVKDGETISAGTMVAKTPRKVAKTKDRRSAPRGGTVRSPQAQGCLHHCTRGGHCAPQQQEYLPRQEGHYH